MSECVKKMYVTFVNVITHTHRSRYTFADIQVTTMTPLNVNLFRFLKAVVWMDSTALKLRH